jgi:hypothetical protein
MGEEEPDDMTPKLPSREVTAVEAVLLLPSLLIVEDPFEI